MTALDRLVVAVVALGLAALVTWWLARRTHRRAARAVAGGPATAAGVLAFHAPWCAACAAQRGQLDDLDVEVRLVDVEQDPEAARRHGVRSLPTTIVVDAHGGVTAVNHGLVTAETLRAQLAGA